MNGDPFRSLIRNFGIEIFQEYAKHLEVLDDLNVEIRTSKLEDFMTRLKESILKVNLEDYKEKLTTNELKVLEKTGIFYPLILKLLIQNKIIKDFNIQFEKKDEKILPIFTLVGWDVDSSESEKTFSKEDN
jgi:hypothetical protein